MGKIKALVCVVVFFTASQWAWPQEEAPAGELKLISVGFSMDNITPSHAELRAGLDLEGFLLLGVLWNMGFGTIGGQPSTELAFGIWADAAVLTERVGLPLSFSIRGDFRKMRTLSSSLEDQNLVQSGSGYTIGAELSKSFTLSQRSSMKLAADGSYLFDMYTLESAAGSGVTFDTQISPYTNYLYGITVGLTSALTDEVSLAYWIKAHLDKDLHIIYGPGFSLESR